MENKYYKPILEEFHSGFEYEKLSISPKGEEHYMPMIIAQPWYEWMDKKPYEINPNIMEYLVPDNIRVREDIESFGFEYKEISSIYGKNDEYGLKINDNEYWIEILKIDYYKVKISGTDPGFNRDGRNYSVKFQGIIKNKSEFKKIMNQLNIK